MKLTALLTIKNEEYYLKYCIENLIRQGFEIYLIDNGSEDDSIKIASQYLNKGVITIDKIDTGGIFKLEEILKYEEQIANSYDSDRYMHCDADEIRIPHVPFKTIKEGIFKIEKLGYNVVDFLEYVFMPEQGRNYEGLNYEKLMKHYYCFIPAPLHRLNLWKRTRHKVDLVSRAGHHVLFEDRKIYPNPFILKHYIFLSEKHGKDKYSKNRIYNKEEVENLGWHGWRANFDENSFVLPSNSSLNKLVVENAFVNTDPKNVHQFYLFSNNKEEKQDDNEMVKENYKSKQKERLLIRLYKSILRIYRKTIPFKIRHKIKSIINNSQYY